MKNGLVLSLLLTSLLCGFTFAQDTGLQIPSEQPICRLYGLIQTFGTVAAVLVAAYSGFQLSSSNDIEERNKAKKILSGVILGLVIIWIAPMVVKELVGATNICGW